MTATNGHLAAQIRQAIDNAHQNGRPTPGRPTLVRLTGATDHAVRKALAELATQCDRTGDQTGPTLVTTSQPGDTSPPAEHQAGEPVTNQPTTQPPATTSHEAAGGHDQHQPASRLAPVRHPGENPAAHPTRPAPPATSHAHGR